MMFHKSKKDILNGIIPEQILVFTVPLIGSYLLQQAYQIADSIILGRYAGKIALAAIGASNSIVNVILNLISGISAGIMIVLAQNMGRGDIDRAKATVKTGMFVAIVLGGVLTLGVVLSARKILELTGCPIEAVNDSMVYLRMYAFSFIPYIIVSVGNYTFRAMGDSKSSITLTLIISITKIVLDVLLTAIFKMGIWGVSISTLAAQAICMIVVLAVFGTTPEFYHYSLLEFGFDNELLKKIISIGVPVAMQNVLFAFSNLIIQAKINTYGTDTIAAFSLYNSVDNYYWCFANAIGSAIITLCGQNYGNKNYKRVKEFVKHGLIIDLIGSALIGAGAIVFGRNLLPMYTTDINVINISFDMLITVALFYPTYIFIEIISGALKACGDTTNSMIITLIGICVVRVCYVLFVKFTSALQILYCYPISWVVTSIIFIVYYLIFKKKKLIDISKEIYEG